MTTNDQSTVHISYASMKVGDGSEVFAPNLVLDRNIQNIFTNAASSTWLLRYVSFSLSVHFRRHSNIRSFKLPLVHRGVCNAWDGTFNGRYVPIKDFNGRAFYPTLNMVSMGTNIGGGTVNGYPDGVIQQSHPPAPYHRMIMAFGPTQQNNDNSGIANPTSDPKTMPFVNDPITEVDVPGTQIGNIFKHPRGRNYFFNEVGQSAFSTGSIAIKGVYNPPDERIGSSVHLVYYTKSGGTGTIQGGFGDSAGVVTNGTTPAQFSKTGGGSFTAPMATDPDGYYICIRGHADPLRNGTFKIVSFIDADTVGIDSKAVGQNFADTGLTWTLRKGPIAEYFVRKRPYVNLGNWSSTVTTGYNSIGLAHFTGDFQSSSIEAYWDMPQRSVHDGLGHWWGVTAHWPGQSTDYRGGIRRWLHMSPQPHDPVYLDGDLQKPGTGTATLTNNSAVVAGSGASFNTEFSNGDRIRFGTQDTALTILTVDGPNQVTLTAPWTGSTTGGLSVWRIMPAGAKNFRDIRCEPEKPVTLSGTLSATHGSLTVTGSGTAFLTDFANMEQVKLNGENYRVDSVASNTSMTLQRPYLGKALSGVAVVKVPRRNLWFVCEGWTGQNARLVKVDPAPNWNSRFPEFTLVAGKQSAVTANDGFQTGAPNGLAIDDSGVYSGGAGTHRIWVALTTDQTANYKPLSEDWGGLAYSDNGGTTWKRLHRLPMAHTIWAGDAGTGGAGGNYQNSGCLVKFGTAVVTSTYSLFSTELANGDNIMFEDGTETIYTISTVDSDTQITLTAPYSKANFAGTVSYNQGNATVTGSGTSFMTDYHPGDYINLSTASTIAFYLVITVTSNTTLTISPTFQPGGSYSGQSHFRAARLYKVLPGSATVSNGSPTVSGAGTSWDTQFAVGDWVRFGADTRSYEVTAVSAASMTLATNYAGTGRASVPVMKGALLPWESNLYRDYRIGYPNLANATTEGQYGPHAHAAPIDYDTLGNIYWIAETYPTAQTSATRFSGNVPANPMPAATLSVVDPTAMMRRICKWDESTGKCISFTEYFSGEIPDYMVAGQNGFDGFSGFNTPYRSAKRLNVARIPKQHSTQTDHPLHNSLWISGDRSNVDSNTSVGADSLGVACILAKHLTSLNKVLTGTVTLVNGSPNVAGLGTSFQTDLRVNDIVRFENSSQPWTPYRVLSITDNFNLTLTANFTGTGIGGTSITHHMMGAAHIRYHNAANVAGTPATRHVQTSYVTNQRNSTTWHDRNTGSILMFSDENSNWTQWTIEMATGNVTGGIGSVIANGGASLFGCFDNHSHGFMGVESDTIGMGWFCGLGNNSLWNYTGGETFGQYSPIWMDKRWDAETQTWKIGISARPANDLVMDGTNLAYGLAPGYGTKRVHETVEPVEDGISIQFNQLGGASPQNGEFISDETSTFCCYIGSGKDNTQEATISYSYYTSPTVYRVNDTAKKLKNYWTGGDRVDDDIGIDGGWAIPNVQGGTPTGTTTGMPPFSRGITELERSGAFGGVTWSESAISDLRLDQGGSPRYAFDQGGGVFVGMTCLRVPDRITVGGGTEPTSDISLLGSNATSIGYTFTLADVGRSIIIEGATNAANNGQAVITAYVGPTTVTTDKTFVAEGPSVNLRWKLRDIPAVGMARWDHTLGSAQQFQLEWQYQLFSSSDYGQNWSVVKTWTTANSGQAVGGPDNKSTGTYTSLGLANIDSNWPDDVVRPNSVWFDLTDLSEASRRRQYWKLRVTRPTGGSNLGHYPYGLRLLDANRKVIAPSYAKFPDVDDPLFIGSNPILQLMVVGEGASVSRGGTPNVYDMTDTVTTTTSIWEDNNTDGVVAITGTFNSAAATPFTVLDIGKFIRITGATNSTNNGYALITSLVSPVSGASQTVQTNKTFVVESSLTWSKLNVQPGDTFRIDSSQLSKPHTRALNDVYFTILDVPTATSVTFSDAVIPRFTGGVAWDINRAQTRVHTMRQVTNFTTLGYLSYDSQFGMAMFSDNLELVKISTGTNTGTTPADSDGDGRSDELTIPLQSDIQNGDVIEVWDSGNVHGRRFYRVKSFVNGANTVITTDFDELHPSLTWSWTLYRRRPLKWRAARTITTVRSL